MTPASEDTRHLTELEVAAYLDRAFRGTDLNRVEGHIAHCAECRDKVVSAEQLIARSRRPRRWMTGAALAAAATFAIVLTPAVRQRFTTEPVLIRDLSSRESLDATGPDGNISRSNIRFSWKRIPTVVDYRAKVFTPDGTVVWSARTSDTSIVVPATVKLLNGQDYVWTIEADLENGEIESSGLHSFRVTDRAAVRNQ